MKTIKLLLLVSMLTFCCGDLWAQKVCNISDSTSTTTSTAAVAVADSASGFCYPNSTNHPTAKSEEALPQKSTTKKAAPTKKQRADRWSWEDGNYMGVNLFYNGLTGTGRGQSGEFMELDTKAVGVDINIIDFVIFSYRRFGIVSGVGIESNNFRFRRNVSLKVDDNNMVVADNQYSEQGITLQKSKLTTTYLNIPLLFQFKLGDSHRNGSLNSEGWLSFGVIAGLRLQNYTKVGLPDGGHVKDFSDMNLRNLHWGVMASVGYFGVTITAKYYPQSIFRTNEGPNNQQFNIGFGFTF
ncbi:MAG: outer membrane beta-barrel protein [Mucinivorans sp.]